MLSLSSLKISASSVNFLLLSSSSSTSIHHLSLPLQKFQSLPRFNGIVSCSHWNQKPKPLRLRCSPSSLSPGPCPNNSELDDEAAAREALLDLLQEHGASQEDSIHLASNCPKYLQSLIDNVRELDDHSLWTSWAEEDQEEGEENFSAVGFKRKVYLMAKTTNKGHAAAILPFLESVGLKLSSAAFIARYLSSESLPDLIVKVRFLRDILFSSRIHEELIGRNARRMMKHLSISIDDDVQGTLSFFEKLEAKHGGLNILGCEDESFPCLIESFPKLLLRSVEHHLKPLVHFLEHIGVPYESVRMLLLLFPPILLYDIEKDIKPRIRALEKAGVEDKDIGRLLLKYPWILSTSIQENYEKILDFFHDKKVPKFSVDTAIKSWPLILGCASHKIESIVDQFDVLGVNGKMLIPIITSSPQLLLRKPSEFLEVVSFMKEIGFDDRTIGRILRRSPEIFAANIDNTIRKKVKFLTDFGISRCHLPRVIRKYPELLLLDIHRTLLPRMRYLMEIGLSKRDVCSMVVKFSPLLGYSVEVVLRPKLEFLSRTMQKPLKEVVEYPRYFSYSLDKKIKHRFLILKSRNIECSMKEMLATNDDKFAEQYHLVAPPLASSSSDAP